MFGILAEIMDSFVVHHVVFPRHLLPRSLSQSPTVVPLKTTSEIQSSSHLIETKGETRQKWWQSLIGSIRAVRYTSEGVLLTRIVSRCKIRTNLATKILKERALMYGNRALVDNQKARHVSLLECSVNAGEARPAIVRAEGPVLLKSGCAILRHARQRHKPRGARLAARESHVFFNTATSLVCVP